jgi:small subunit ribosomal protein S16
MLKIRLKRNGRKRQPSYRMVIIESKTRRDGRPVDEVGFYNPITKQLDFDEKKIIKWLIWGAQPTKTVYRLLKPKVPGTTDPELIEQLTHTRVSKRSKQHTISV